MSKCSIYHKDCSHTVELEALLARHPQPAHHDQVHYIFASSYTGKDRTSVPIGVDSLGLYGDALAWYIAKIITTDVDAVLELHVRTVDELHRHPAWRIWCANYTEDEEGRKQFKEDWEYIKNMVSESLPEALAVWPEYSEALDYLQGREVIFQAISAYSNA